MARKRIIVATPYPRDLGRWQSVLASDQDLTITAHAPDLMELFNEVEHNTPNLVLISADLCAAEEFELIVMLFTALDVRWLMFHGPNCKVKEGSYSPGKSKGGGLFPLSLLDGAVSLLSVVKSTVFADRKEERQERPTGVVSAPRFKRMVLIGSSTGGVDALKEVLSKFGPDCPPTAVVQHTSRGFGAGLVQVLSRSCAARVELFRPNALMRSGTVCVVAGVGQHVVLTPEKQPHLQPDTAPALSGHCPSIDMMFLSAVPMAQRIVGCIRCLSNKLSADFMRRL